MRWLAAVCIAGMLLQGVGAYGVFGVDDVHMRPGELQTVHMMVSGDVQAHDLEWAVDAGTSGVLVNGAGRYSKVLQMQQYEKLPVDVLLKAPQSVGNYTLTVTVREANVTGMLQSVVTETFKVLVSGEGITLTTPAPTPKKVSSSGSSGGGGALVTVPPVVNESASPQKPVSSPPVAKAVESDGGVDSIVVDGAPQSTGVEKVKEALGLTASSTSVNGGTEKAKWLVAMVLGGVALVVQVTALLYMRKEGVV